MKRIWTLRLLLAITLFRQEAFAQTQPQTHTQGGDVYNFYFQKAPGPQTVIQGGARPENSVQVRETPDGMQVIQNTNPTPAAPVPTTTAAAEKKQAEEDFKKWAFRLGFESRSQDSGGYDEWGTAYQWSASGTSIGASYSFNKYIALDGSVLFTSRVYNSEDPRLSFNYRQIYPYLGIEFTPLRFVLFNYDLLDISFIGGITSHSLNHESNRADFYRGFKLTINVSSNFALGMMGRFTGENQSGEGGLSLAWRF